ncbi:hypothetical protein EV360DRAFT_47466 [Lentinula raphanica]|nr:hypothetical protein EV360DRAFT_47466 [Lentinula raphanica]
MFYSSEWKDFSRGTTHSQAVEKFLSGRCQHHPGEIIHNWYTSPDGRFGDNDPAASQMWSTSEPTYSEINHIRACLTSFAAQTCIKHAVQQAKTTVKPENGLHVRLSVKDDSGSSRSPIRTDWADIGNNTVSRVGDIFRTHEPFLFDFLSCIASGKHSIDGNLVRKTRPIDMVVTHTIAALNFSLNRSANWLPVARGIFYFAASAPSDLCAYESRTGTMPAYSTLYSILRDLGVEEGRATRSAGSNPKLWGKVFFDNTQRYLRQSDMRIGRENKMSIGIAGTYVEYGEGTFPPEAHDLDDKDARVAKNERANLDVRFFHKLINYEHLETVGTLQWLDTLVTYIPEISQYKEHVRKLYETTATINQLPPTQSKIHCLSTVAKNENVTPELYSTIINFFAQIGQTEDTHLHRIWPFGGDGLTYQRLLELKRYVQFHENDLRNLSSLEPQLEWWHMMWTDLNRIFETHWGEPLSKDPSTLGHSSRKIGRDDPSNLKKIDYYPGVQLAYLVLDARMLDCWRLAFGTSDLFGYFRELHEQDRLPTVEELKSIAQGLFMNYSTTAAYQHAMRDAGASEDTSPWTASVPVGTPWLGAEDPSMEDLGLSFTGPTVRTRPEPATKSKEPKKQTRKDKEAEEERDEHRRRGDRVLANSISFMRDALLSRECANAVASGDVGRVWEVIKVLLFTFAGSSHSKYATYLLETITSLELESSKSLRDSLLRTMLVNLSGKPGAFSPCDIVQEYFNRLLEFIVERKGKEFDHAFIQHIISRNLHRMSQIKLESRVNVGLARHAGRHSEPHSNPEIRILLNQYAHHELHSRRMGRYIEERNTENFLTGWAKLEDGKLAKWIRETAGSRGRQTIDALVAARNQQPDDTDAALTTPDNSTLEDETLNDNTLNGNSHIDDSHIDDSHIDDSLNDDSLNDDSYNDDSYNDSGVDIDCDGNEDDYFQNSLGVTEVRDGCLLITTLDLEQAAEVMLTEYEAFDIAG